MHLSDIFKLDVGDDDMDYIPFLKSIISSVGHKFLKVASNCWNQAHQASACITNNKIMCNAQHAKWTPNQIQNMQNSHKFNPTIGGFAYLSSLQKKSFSKSKMTPKVNVGLK